MYSLRSIGIVTILAISLLNCSNSTSSETDAEPDEGMVTLGNNGASSYTVKEIEGEGVRAEEGTENAVIELRVNGRYTFRNEAGASSHPLNFVDSDGNKLIGQGNGEGSFDSDAEVNVFEDGNNITFTVTQPFAAELAEYICAFHPDMNGIIVAYD